MLSCMVVTVQVGVRILRLLVCFALIYHRSDTKDIHRHCLSKKRRYCLLTKIFLNTDHWPFPAIFNPCYLIRATVIRVPKKDAVCMQALNLDRKV